MCVYSVWIHIYINVYNTLNTQRLTIQQRVKEQRGEKYKRVDALSVRARGVICSKSVYEEKRWLGHGRGDALNSLWRAADSSLGHFASFPHCHPPSSSSSSLSLPPFLSLLSFSSTSYTASQSPHTVYILNPSCIQRYNPFGWRS